MKQKGLAPILIVVLVAIAFSVAGYFVWSNYSNNQTKTMGTIPYQVQSTPAPTKTEESTNSAETANWKTYTNTKYNYSVKFPNEYGLGVYNAVSGSFFDARPDDERIGIYQTSKDVFANFLEIQIYKIVNQNLKDVASANYQKNSNHFKTTFSSDLNEIEFNGYPSYQYSFRGEAIHTRNWEGVVTSDEYKIIFIGKDDAIIAIYLTNSASFNQILSTFKFTN